MIISGRQSECVIIVQKNWVLNTSFKAQGINSRHLMSEYPIALEKVCFVGDDTWMLKFLKCWDVSRGP